MDRTAAFYMQPSYEFHGSGFPVFAGAKRQRGGSIFGSLKRFFSPIAKSVGRKLLSHGVGLAQDIASDALAGKNIKDSILTHGRKRAKDIGKSALTEGLSSLTSMIGKGKRTKSSKRLRRKRKVKRVVRKRSRSSTSRKSKRRAPSSSQKRPTKKRRVSNF